MAYCQTQDIINSITESTVLQLTDDTNAGQIDQTLLEVYMQSSSDEIDSYLSVRYPLPIAAIEESAIGQLREACADLTIYRLFNRRQRGDTDNIISRRNQVISWLKQVRDRKANIVSLDDQTGSQDNAGSYIVKKSNSQFKWEQY